MAHLEDLTAGAIIAGILANEPITVVSMKWYGTASVEVYYKTHQGATGSQILYREDEPGLTVLEKTLPWSFDVDAKQMRLVSEAYRIHLAHLFDPYLAVHTSAIEPLPHQISAVYEEMLPRLPLRYVLADDPGAGKTIMTGLLLKELIIRGDLRRCMIVCPGNLAEQWQDELFQKFHLRFEILTNDRLESAVSGNVFTEINYCIARLDKLARNVELQEKLKNTDWDLIVCDEAHKMSATIWGNETHYTKRFQLGRLLSEIARHFLLLTATPHNGKEEDFQLFMSLKMREAAGKENSKLNSTLAQRRADDLQARMKRRLDELEQEKKVSPCSPVIMGGVLVIPLGLLNRLMGRPNTGSLFGQDRSAIEQAAMNAVMQRERYYGFAPTDVSAQNVGYDIESSVPLAWRDGTQCLRFIEVKGRRKGSTTVTVTRNEILTALNKPEKYILAIVDVDGATTHTIYIRKPFGKAPDAGACSVNYEIADLIRNGVIEE